MTGFLKELPRLIVTPVLVLGTLALGLYLLGMVPDYIRPPEYGPREYASIEEAEAVLGMRIALPSYFPDYLSWPPETIRGQYRPFREVQTVFFSRYGRAGTLLILQRVSSAEIPGPLPWVHTLREETPVPVNDYEGVMFTGTAADGQTLHGAYWKTEKFHFVVVTTRSARELLTISRSLR